MPNLPPITQKQHEIIQLLYRYRFLNRTQIQQLLGHKDKRRIISWLKDLREKLYIDWHYDATNFMTKSRPAVYFLSLNAIRLLNTQETSRRGELRKRYNETSRTQMFVDKCLLIADCCIALRGSSNNHSAYTWVLRSDYADPASNYNFLTGLKPQLFFTKHRGESSTNYILESFEQTLPRYQMRKRIIDLVSYIAEDWDEYNGPPPIALLICATKADFMYAKRRIELLLEENTVYIRLTTLDKICASGIASMIWEEISQRQ